MAALLKSFLLRPRTNWALVGFGCDVFEACFVKFVPYVTDAVEICAES
jgi:hypothetical protein